MALLLFGVVHMELGELKVFLMVAEERSFSRAATKLYRTQPAVSQAVRRLEDQLGERLFDRTTKNATLTDAGAVLLREGTRLVRLADETTAAVRRQSERGRAIVRVAGSEVAAHVVLPAISAFLREQDGSGVEFHSIAEADIVAAVTAGTFEIGVVMQERVPAATRGRVFGAVLGGVLVAAPVGMIVLGAAADVAGPRMALLISGATILAAGGIVAILRTSRELDRSAPP